MRHLIAFMLALTLATPAGAGSWGWGKGTVDECDNELREYLVSDILSLKKSSTFSHMKMLSRKGAEMLDWCRANISLCRDEMREVERRGCFTSPGTVTYNLNSRDGSWTMNCTNTTLKMPSKC